jgi:hypothetical protein
MRYSAIPLTLSAVVLILSANLAQAQQAAPSVSDSSDAAIQQRAAAHMRTVRGIEDAASIPYGIKLRKFFRQVDRQLVTDEGRDRLKATLQLSHPDWELLTTAAQRNRSAMDAIEQADQKRMRDICQRASVGELEPAALGRSLTQAHDQHEKALTQHYKALVERLSPEGQRALLSYVDGTVSRSMSYGRIDFEGLLTEFPEIAADLARKCASSAEPGLPQEATGTSNGFAAGEERQ